MIEFPTRTEGSFNPQWKAMSLASSSIDKMHSIDLKSE